MPIHSTEEAVRQFCIATTKHAEATETGEYKIANAAYTQLIEALRWLHNSQETKLLHSLLAAPSVGTRLWTASYLLLLGDSVAKAVLIELASINNIHGSNAEITLREWQMGRLKPFI